MIDSIVWFFHLRIVWVCGIYLFLFGLMFWGIWQDYPKTTGRYIKDDDDD